MRALVPEVANAVCYDRALAEARLAGWRNHYARACSRSSKCCLGCC